MSPRGIALCTHHGDDESSRTQRPLEWYVVNDVVMGGRSTSTVEEEAVGGEGGGGGGGDAAAGLTPLSSDALEELRRALDPSSPEQIVAFAVEIESHHVGDSGKGGAAAVGGGVLEAPEAGGGVMAQGRESDWHRCVDGLQRSGVDVADTEARTWLRRAKR